jgi:hypothetical protein
MSPARWIAYLAKSALYAVFFLILDFKVLEAVAMISMELTALSV